MLVLPALLRAHPANLTSALATIQTDGELKLTLNFDVLAYALNDSPYRIPDDAMNALLDGPRPELDRRMQLARGHFRKHFKILVDGRPLAAWQLQFPTTAEVEQWKANGTEPRLPVLLACVVRARLPAGANRVAFQFPDIIDHVVLTVERPDHEPATELVADGAPSSDFPVALAPGAARPTSVSKRLVNLVLSVGQFVRLGFEHIVPRGLDHILFVLGLFLLGGRLSTLLWQVTAFTIAHSLTLGLALYGVLRLPPHLVEPLIALSIVLVAVDNLRGAGLHWWRVAVVFGFGLVHGMGFAAALRGMGLARSEFLRALFGFNVGVELGQLAVIAAAFAAVGWWRAKPRYRQFVVIPASVAIAGVALVWTVERTLAA